MRISELAAELGVSSAFILAELKKMKITGKTASSSIESATISSVKKTVAGLSAKALAEEKEKAAKAAKKRGGSKKTETEHAAPAPKEIHAAPKVDDAAAQKAAEEAENRRKAEAEAKQKADAEAKRKAEAEAKVREAEKKKADEARRLADMERQKKAEEAKKAEKEQIARKKAQMEEERELQRLIAEEERAKREQEAKTVIIEEAMVVKEFAEKLRVPVSEVIKRLFLKGTAVTLNQTIGVDLATDLAKEMGFTIRVKEIAAEEETKAAQADTSHLPLRPPVVTIMGHVDHGKTSLLDAIRKTEVAAGEAGGITQHIGAYTISGQSGSITFIDTPGHEAFTALRARGAKVTDLVVLVVAADDGVMPQTIEAINHAKAAQVSILVAVNKIDKPGATPDKIKQELTKYGLVTEEWGGQTVFCNVSAKTGQGLDHLLEMIQIQSDVLDLRAEPNQMAVATVIESRLEKSKGPVVNLIVNRGTLKIGDPFVAGTVSGKVRALVNDKGQQVKEAGPSMPVELLGATDACTPGEILTVVESERKARQICQSRLDAQKDRKMASKQHVRLENVVESLHEGEMMELRLVLKGDTQGSVEAVAELLSKLAFVHVKLQIIHSGVGAITETDVMLADASDAIVIGFNVRPTEKAKALALKEKIDLRLYNIIYEVADSITAAVKGMLKPKIVERTIGRAEVRNAFRISKVGMIAGCMVVDGLIRRNAPCRLIRDNVVVYTGIVGSLKRFKDDAREVQTGYECGIGIENFNDIKVGDVIEQFVKEEVAEAVTA
ncbi:MAG: translation initiation factor IF-2 [Nitrospinae bacterium]|nr:translation initiation factor IF-2 [Nitrospinota bacterium]